MGRIFYDDNFGVWDGMDDPDTQEFFRRMQDENVEKVCVDCGRTVWIKKDYECCNACANRREYGGY